MNATAPTQSTRAPFPWAWFVVVTLVALALRLAHLDHAPHVDEFYHLLAAGSLLEDGDLCIAACLEPYARGAPFTYLVAAAMGIFGSGLVVARLVSVVAGILLVTGVFWWTWRVAGRTAAVAAGLLLAMSPEAIYISQFVRFYGWQALLIGLGAAALFMAVHTDEASAGRRWMIAGIGGLALFGALTLQVTTLIAAAGIAVWVLLDPVARWARDTAGEHPGRVGIAAAGGILVVVIAVGLMAWTGTLAELWAKYQSTNMFTALVADDIRFYHRYLTEAYPTFYSLLPVAFVIALWKRPAAALFTGSVFAVALVLQSGGGFKATRFLFYAMPFFFTLWGLALGVVLPPLAQGARTGAARWLGRDPDSPVARASGALLMALALFCVLATNTAYNTTFKMVTVSDAEWPATKPRYRGRPEWRPALTTLRNVAESSGILVTTSSVKSMYYLGETDAELTVTRLYTGSGFAPDFSVDPRVGIPVFKSPEAMERLVRCYPTGVVIVESGAWGSRWGVLPETAAYISANMEEIILPPGSDLRAFRWAADGSATPCAEPPLSHPADARAVG